MCMTLFVVLAQVHVRFICFVFSSRRRHTRLTCDWSSDVCPSDLGRNIFDPDSRVYNSSGLAVSATQFPGNVIPASRLNRVSQQLFEFFPRATRPGDNILSNYSRD